MNRHQPHALEQAARHLAATQTALHAIGGGRVRTAEDHVRQAWTGVVQMPDLVRVFTEGSPDLAALEEYERTVRCRAVRLTEPAVVRTRKGWVNAEPGEWVAEDSMGGLYTVDHEVFEARGCRKL